MVAAMMSCRVLELVMATLGSADDDAELKKSAIAQNQRVKKQKLWSKSKNLQIISFNVLWLKFLLKIK